MKNHLKTTAALFAIAAAFSLQGAKAQFTPGLGDLIFGAEKISNGAAVGDDLEVDLGPISNFSTTATLTFPNVSATDLASVLGSNFGTATGDFWGVVGTTNLSDVDGYFNRATFITLNDDPGALSKTGLTTSSSEIFGVYTGMSSTAAVVGTPAPNSNGTGVEVPAAGNSQSFSVEEGNPFFNFIGGGSTNFNSGVALDLYALNSAGDATGVRNNVGTDTLLGSFSYSTATGLTFTGADVGAATVPEPSTYALLGLGAAALFFVARRRALQS